MHTDTITSPAAPLVRTPEQWTEADMPFLEFLREVTEDHHFAEPSFVFCSKEIASEDAEEDGPEVMGYLSTVIHRQFVEDVSASPNMIRKIMDALGYSVLTTGYLNPVLVDGVIEAIPHPDNHIIVCGYMLTESEEFMTTGILICPHQLLYPALLN